MEVTMHSEIKAWGRGINHPHIQTFILDMNHRIFQAISYMQIRNHTTWCVKDIADS